MIFADILFWFLMVAGAYLALNASWLAAVALFRPAVERAHETYATRPVAATLAGLGALVPAVGVFVVFARAAHPGVKLLTGACSAGGQCSRSSSSFPFSGGSRCSP